ncbi:hypothetical protein [Pseudomonas moorei]|jgi:hypothetical protein|uniref:Uncharacterized protein n=1 Tax=Pseudomonas moorei TaxID=395599 RepID=A0A1H1D2P7_9PSED|nr:hypothetical protein [Pseudomonas moorei]KAB0504542.1 hypothetical protein F7R06_12500 [Pseudomonas moorei]SDQ70428.1 hypothetical protein SAMN04490195_1505 [Pseudomonas moorei]
MDLIELIWPAMEPLTSQELKLQDARHKQDIAKINIARWAVDTDAALEEARRLDDAESDRRKTADSKASIYLAAVTALTPVLASLLPSIWSDKSTISFSVCSLAIFFLATLYLFRAGIWAFETLRVSTSSRVDATDLASLWSAATPKPELVKKLLIAVRYNHAGANRKVSCIKMTHAFLLRAFLAFILLLIVQVAWTPAGQLIALVIATVRCFN